MADAENADNYHFDNLDHPRFAFKIPTNFKLLQELEEAEKLKTGDNIQWVSVGTDDDEEIDMAHPLKRWEASIIPEQGKHIGDRIYTLKISVGPEYPTTWPTVWFKQMVSVERGLVNQDTGELNMQQFCNNYGFRWTPESSILLLCTKIRDGPLLRHSKECAQIKESQEYLSPGYKRKANKQGGWSIW